ncbi:uncharacterized protein LOC144166550 [Haemaphysalis longicornis]
MSEEPKPLVPLPDPKKSLDSQTEKKRGSLSPTGSRKSSALPPAKKKPSVVPPAHDKESSPAARGQKELASLPGSKKSSLSAPGNQKGSPSQPGNKENASTLAGSKKGSISPPVDENAVLSPSDASALPPGKKKPSLVPPAHDKGSSPTAKGQKESASIPGSKKSSLSAPGSQKGSPSQPGNKENASALAGSKKGSISPPVDENAVLSPSDASALPPGKKKPSVQPPSRDKGSSPAGRGQKESPSLPGSKKSSLSAPGSQKGSSFQPGNKSKASSLAGSKTGSTSQPAGSKKGSTSQPVAENDTSNAYLAPPGSNGTDWPVGKNEEEALRGSVQYPLQDQQNHHDPFPLPKAPTSPQPAADDRRNAIIGVAVVVAVVVTALFLLRLSKAKGPDQDTSTTSTTGGPPQDSSTTLITGAGLRALCESEACQRVASQLRRGLNPRSPPCDDFYEHVCGAWKDPPHEGDELFQKLVDDVGEATRGQTIPTAGQTAIQKAAMAYQSCEDIVAKNSTSMATAKRILEEAGFFSSALWDRPVSILNATFFLALTWRIASPFRIEYMQHTKLGFTLRIAPSQSVTAYVKRRQHPDWGSRSEVAFQEMEGTFQQGGEPKITYDEWKLSDDRVTKEWKNILVASQGELQAWNESTILEAVKGMTESDWTFLLDTYFNSPKSLRFYIDSPKLFSSFAMLLDIIGADMVRPYYRWYMVEILACVVYAPWIIRRHGDYKNALKHHRRFCFAITEKSAGYAFLAPYVKTAFSTRVEDDITNTLRQVRGAYAKLLAESEAFRPNISVLPSYASNSGRVFDLFRVSGDATLEEHYAQYEDMTSDPLENWKRLRVGLTKSFYGHVTMDSAGAAVKTVRFFTLDYVNFDFTLRPDVAVLPFFDPSLPAELKLAGLGLITASAMAETLHASLGRTQPASHAWNETHACMHSHGLRTSSEPDLLKRTVALAAVVTALNKPTDGAAPLVLRDVPELSGIQLLFAAWCNLKCGDAYGQKLCNEPVRELRSFAETFHCGADAKMRKATTCTAGWF